MARRRASYYGIVDYWEPNTCNTIDDVTGIKVKLKDTRTRWDNIQTTDLNFEQRQPQDYPVIPRPQKVYMKARSAPADPVPVPYDPATGWSDLES